jgi:hypothetical protein
MIKFDATEIMPLISLASKACEFRNEWMTGLLNADKVIEADQVHAQLYLAIDVLKKLDEKYPGVIPLPHTNVPWREFDGT